MGRKLLFLVGVIVLCSASCSRTATPVSDTAQESLSLIKVAKQGSYTQIVSSALTYAERYNDWSVEVEDYTPVRVSMAYDCVREKGHRVPDTPKVLTSAVNNAEAWNDVVQWLTSGNTNFLAFAENPALFEEKRPNHNKVELSPAAQEAYLGDLDDRLPLGGGMLVGIGGCKGEVVEELYGVDVKTFEKTRYEAGRPYGAFRASLASAELVDAVHKYSSCMSVSGYSVKSPGDMPSQLEGTFASLKEGVASLSEMKAAEERYNSVDNQCKLQSGVSEVFAEIYVRKVIEAEGEAEMALAAYSEMQAHARAVAKEKGFVKE